MKSFTDTTAFAGNILDGDLRQQSRFHIRRTDTWLQTGTLIFYENFPRSHNGPAHCQPWKPFKNIPDGRKKLS